MKEKNKYMQVYERPKIQHFYMEGYQGIFVAFLVPKKENKTEPMFRTGS